MSAHGFLVDAGVYPQGTDPFSGSRDEGKSERSVRRMPIRVTHVEARSGLVIFAISSVEEAPESGALMIAAAPVIGFVIHQLCGAMFERYGGWERGDRKVLRGSPNATISPSWARSTQEASRWRPRSQSRFMASHHAIRRHSAMADVAVASSTTSRVSLLSSTLRTGSELPRPVPPRPVPRVVNLGKVRDARRAATREMGVRRIRRPSRAETRSEGLRVRSQSRWRS